MANYAFADDEHVVLKAQEVRLDTGKSFSIPRGSELMLTNRNIVLTRKGLTGKVKGFDVFPLSDIRIVDGKPQCRLDKSEFMEVKLELLLKSGLVTFVFGSLDGKKEIREWINAINQILMGHDAPQESLGKGRFESLVDEERIADAAGRIFGTFQNALKRKRTEAAEDVAAQCPSCNASVRGKPGTTVACPYCGTYVNIA